MKSDESCETMEIEASNTYGRFPLHAYNYYASLKDNGDSSNDSDAICRILHDVRSITF